MITNILLKFSQSSSIAPTPIPVTPITVFVGPNNSGKSKVLSEISQFCKLGNKDATNVILDSIEFRDIPVAEVNDRLARVLLPPNIGEALLPDHVIIGRHGAGRTHVNKQGFLDALTQANARM